MLLSRRACLAGLAGAALPSLARAPLARAASPDTPKGTLPMAGKLTHLAYSDQGGRPDGVQVMVSRNVLYVGHMFSNGFTVMDVANPAKPTPLKFVAAPANTRTHHLQTNGDLMLLACGADIPTIGKYNPGLSYYQQSFGGSMAGKADFAAGLKIYDISKPAEPREIGFLNIPGIGINRLWYAGGRYAYLSAHMDGFTDHILVIADIQDPAKPEIVGKWWIPGMWKEGGETPSWSGKRVALHHMIVAGDTGYAAWRDGGTTLLDLTDKTKPKLISHVNTAPPFPGGTHTPLPLPGRKLAVILDESSGFNCSKGLSYTWIYDVRSPANPVSIATLPTPTDQQFCRPGENFGPHNLHENRPETFQSEELIFATYHNAGLRVFDIRNAFAPREVASFVPPAPTRILDPRPGNALAPQSCDVNVQSDGIVYLSDWNAGLHVLRYEG
ncbi:hypothetical protein [Azorhizobium sp. AG788]|uniref:LVIVD repeat-containing protein n=1 Tax=Azorhizobium sp. AG788 TaxID=2183897 RepID=UPI00313917B2